MGSYVAKRLIKKMKKKNIKIKGAKILVLGLTFKENCPDIRNTGVEGVIIELKKHKCQLDLFDPYVKLKDMKVSYNILENLKLNQNTYDSIIIAVAHDKFKKLSLSKIKSLCKINHVIFDIKNIFNSNKVDLKL